MHRQIVRRDLLRLGAAGAAGALVVPTVARAQKPAPAPQGDDIGYVQWGVTAELLSVAFWQRALDDGDFSKRAQRRLREARDNDADHLKRLVAVLGEDAPAEGDFEVVLPDAAFKTRARILAFGKQIEEHVTAVYLDGVARTTDQETRALLGRLLVADTGHLALLRNLAGEPVADTGLRTSMRVETAGTWIDTYLRTP
ncbi:ferritin-like domain-containing protein [Solirubrobacter phytolaccae]|uniref:Ferritin-like domain-containing protein n=1 Tax=Solirubrobacter phytolaccae TaxID=1404360 RepID=A0A9X3NH73_9ACTN|nr:ferritin-like domain-containing protein [Solirubrobacter phytolaccae]MDA0185319.1 ferritin-like domain-containing protein [Solirubrobacter phytolaccae]